MKYIILLFLLSCLSFFSPTFLPFKVEEQNSKIIVYLFYLLWLILILRKKNENNIYDVSYRLILWSMIISVFMASTQHSEQSLPISIIATLPYIIPYSSFFLLRKSKIDIEKLEKIIIIIGIINVVLVFQLWLLLPNQLFGSIRDEDDGRGVRIAILGDIFKMFVYFYSINKYIVTKNKKWILLVILCLVTIIMSLTRQVILISILLGFLMFFIHVSMMKKIIGIIVIAIAVNFISTMPFVENLMTVSERQMNQKEDDIRIKAAKYYTNDAQEGVLTRLFGNGCFSYGNSQYGTDSKRAQYLTLCFPSDVGLCSFYYFFGIGGALGLILITIITFRLKVPTEYTYLKYTIYYILLASIASGPVLYYSQSIMLPFTCYLLGKVYEYSKNKNRDSNIKLQ